MVATAATVASAFGGYVWYEQQRPKVLEIYVFALKSGRSMFIRTPDDYRILVDGGGNSEIIRHLTSLIPFYSRRIDSIIITNTNGKNVSGLIDIVDRYMVDRVYIPKFILEGLGLASLTDKIYETFIETIKSKNIYTKEISAGDELVLGGNLLNTNNGSNSNKPISTSFPTALDSVGDLRVLAKIIFPVQPDSFDYSRASAPEILMNISYGDSTILFLGDASKKVQKFIASSTNRTDVLIVSHSALSANMSPELMSLIQPKLLIYSKVVAKSALDNSEDPKKSAAKKLTVRKKSVADPFATILDGNRFNLKEVGTVKITSDGKGVTITANDY